MGLKGDKTKVGLMLSGQQIPIEGVGLFITQPTIKQIVTFGEDDFLTSVHWLVKYKNFIKSIKQGNPELEKYSDFQLLMTVLEEEPSLKSMVDKLFILVFPEYVIKIEEGILAFYVQSKEEDIPDVLVGQLHQQNFDPFLDLIHDLFLMPTDDDGPNREYNPVNDAAAAIAKKLERGRQKRAEQQGPQSIFGIYCSVLSIGMNMDINVFFNYTPFQLYDTYRRFFEKMASDFYQRVSTMPFMDTSKMDIPKEWSRNLY